MLSSSSVALPSERTTGNGSPPTWNWLAVQLVTTSDKGDPDLYGLFRDPADATTHPVAEVYAYDFMQTSASRSVVGQFHRDDFSYTGAPSYDGAYLCVTAYGDQAANFTMRVAEERCQATFGPDGGERVCSTPPGTPTTCAFFRFCLQRGWVLRGREGPSLIPSFRVSRPLRLALSPL